MPNLRRGMMAAAGDTGPPFEPTVTGTLWSWGRNAEGQLGLGDTTDRSSPTQIGALATWSVIAPGGNSYFAMQSDGSLWGWGQNNYGQLGLGDTTNRSSPVQVGSLTDWRKIAGPKDRTTWATKSSGQLWAWGAAGYGGLGNNQTATNECSPIQIGSLTDWNGNFFRRGGDNLAFPVKDDGTLWIWGAGNTYGMYGNSTTGGTAFSSPVQIGSLTDWAEITMQAAEDPKQAFSVKTDGTVWMWGHNQFGTLGQGDTTDRSSPVQVGSLTNWSYGAATNEETVASVKTDGTIWSWGNGRSGQSGHGDATNRSSPVQIGALTDWAQGSLHFSAGVTFYHIIKTDGTLWCWGNNNGSDGRAGQLGTNNTTNYSSPVQIGSDTDWLSVYNGYQGGCAIRSA